MEYNIKLDKDELDFILNALRYLENENLNKGLVAIENTRYEELEGMYANREFFNQDMEYKKKIICEQIQAIDEIIEKIENEMYEED
jgi:hypothetical protein